MYLHDIAASSLYSTCLFLQHHQGEAPHVLPCQFVKPDFKSGGHTSAQTLDWNVEVHLTFPSSALVAVSPGLCGQELNSIWPLVECSSRGLPELRPRLTSLPNDLSLNQLLLRTLPLNLTAMHQLGDGLLTASLIHSAVTVGTVVLWCVATHKYIYTQFNGGLHRSILPHRLLALHFNLLW